MKYERYYYSPDVRMTSVPIYVDGNGVPVSYGYSNNKLVNLPRLTICGIYDEESETLTFGLAKCSPKDTFVKKIGRELAKKHAIETPVLQVVTKSLDKFEEYFYKYSHQFAEQLIPIKVEL